MRGCAASASNTNCDAQYYPPAGLTVKVNEFITYPNGTTVTNPYSMLQFGKGGLAVLMFPNGTTLTFNITSIGNFTKMPHGPS